ncbi:YmdB family metallophosphoesterase [Patescibacteria group bacterium]|nr:YmdB family metallophosphoesterase [Patescibacteria group bacterium]MBU2219557.1 YmdB family metallophosphoesterase [Patescibacteria group bacterium]MBU2265359.1 YmdB family metallophosphoesterase [Patescibacteria group bacterium]
MKILFFGDIVGRAGRQAVKQILPQLKQEFEPDLVLANGENAAHGQGLTEEGAKEILAAGVDYLTGGDHAFALGGSEELLADASLPVLRPLNWPGDVAGRGSAIIIVGAKRVLLISLIGRVFMRHDFDDPFVRVKELLEDYSLAGQEQGSEKVDAIILDFHAEATSEKAALGWWLDGQISALLGTHTHVPTADEKILPAGSAFISDVGMVGVMDSVLGADKDIVIKRFLTQRLFRMDPALGRQMEINAVLLELDDKTGLAKNISRVRRIVYQDEVLV